MSDDHNRPVARRKEFHCPWFEKEKQMITALRAEVERLTTSGIAEVAAHNPSVMDYMRHWEGRAEKAEAEVERLRAALVKVDIYLARDAVGLAQDTIQSALEKKP